MISAFLWEMLQTRQPPSAFASFLKKKGGEMIHSVYESGTIDSWVEALNSLILTNTPGKPRPI